MRITGLLKIPLVSAVCVACAGSSTRRLEPAVPPGQANTDSAPNCHVQGSPAVADSLRLGCLQAIQRFSELMGRPAWQTRVIEVSGHATKGYLQAGALMFEVGDQAGLDQIQHGSGQRLRRMVLDDIVAHELGHLNLFAYLRAFGPDSSDGYGTALPDWIDEGFATWHEFEEDRRQRYALLADVPASELDLLSFASRRHPRVQRDPPIRRAHVAEFKFTPRDPSLCEREPAICDPHGLGGPHVRILTWIDTLDVLHVDTVFPGDPRFDWFNAGNYYTVVSTILPFLHQHGGPALIREVIRRAYAGAAPVELFTDLPGLPPQPADVNRAWIEFVRSLARSPDV